MIIRIVDKSLDKFFINKNTNDIAQKMKFSIKDFFSKCDQIFPVDLAIFTEEILNGKLHFFVQCDEHEKIKN